MAISKRPLYMKRTLLLIIMAGYMALLVLLLVTSWYLIADYQMNNREMEMDALNRAIETTEDAMDMIDRHVYDVYAYNKYFAALSGNLSDLDNYQNAYYLRDSMQNKMLLEENLHGFFIFYDRLSRAWYRVDDIRIKADKGPAVKAALDTRIRMVGNQRNWSVLAIDDQVVLAITCRKENVAVAGVHSLSGLSAGLEESMDTPFETVLLNGKSALMGRELAESLDLAGALSESADVYSGRIGKHYVHARRLKKTNMWVCVALQYTLWSVMNVQQLILLIVTLCSMFAVLMLYRFVRRHFLLPIRELTDTMNRIRLGEIDRAPVTQARFKELKDVELTLNAMVTEIERQKLLVYEEIIDKQKAQMQYLQLQLKPHFYLNSLKTLNALALNQETEKMRELIFSLSTHLRYLLKSGQRMVTLSMEMEFVGNYVQMQKHIVGRTVGCEFSVDEEALHWSVPILCIQTFVENSVKYAKLGDLALPLSIFVSAEILSVDGEKYLDLVVRDNGQGYPENVLDQLDSGFAPEDQNIGVNNIIRRCALLHGDKFEYRFYNEGGAVSELILPGG